MFEVYSSFVTESIYVYMRSYTPVYQFHMDDSFPSPMPFYGLSFHPLLMIAFARMGVFQDGC